MNKVRNTLRSMPRRGVAVIMLLVLLTAIGGMTALYLQTTLKLRRQALVAEERAQADLLAESGARLARLRRSVGETSGSEWNISGHELRGGATVTLQIEAEAATTRVTARYPQSADRPKQSTVTVIKP